MVLIECVFNFIVLVTRRASYRERFSVSSIIACMASREDRRGCSGWAEDSAQVVTQTVTLT